MNNKLSIIVPIYNKESTLIKCIDSILTTKYSNYEVILVNDGSLDKSLEICNQYAKKNANIFVVDKENEGLMKARFDGVMRAKGSYITFVDSDDWIIDDLYTSIMNTINSTDIDIYDIGSNYYDSDDMLVGNYAATIHKEGLYSEEQINGELIPLFHKYSTTCKTIGNSLCMKIIRKDIIEEVYLNTERYDLFWGEDMLISFPCILKSRKIYVSHLKGYCYRYDCNKIKQTNLIKYRDDMAKVYAMLRNIYIKHSKNEMLTNNLDEWYIRFLADNLSINIDQNILFPFNRVKKGAKVVLWGAGKIGKKYYAQNELLDYCNIVMWVDKNYQKFDSKINDPKFIIEISYDVIVVAIKNEKVCEEVKEYLIKNGIKEEKIISMYNI